MNTTAKPAPSDNDASAAGNPFRLLDPFTKHDRLFGRDADVVLVVARIASARTTLLFASTGIGKTSFLQAKLIPHLEQDYSIVMFSGWAGDRPAADLRRLIVTHFEAAQSPSRQEARRTLRTALGKPASTRSDKPVDPASLLADDSNRPKPLLLILDQFEELFQRGSAQPRVRKCVSQLAWLIRTFPVRVVIAMREEFLGELSVFDNRLPDIFANHYRLKRPSRQEAASIIRQTVELSGRGVSEPELQELVHDLSRLKPGLVQDAGESGSLSEFVSPPFLQISCYRIWNREQPTTDHAFLESYVPGTAHGELEQFCKEQLRKLGGWRRYVVLRCSEYLVNRRGTKDSYDSNRLARLVRLPRRVVRSALDGLTRTRTRILRKWSVNNVPWYELYHDIYAPIVQGWSDDSRWWRYRVYRPVAIILCILLGVILQRVVHDYSQIKLLQLQQPLADYGPAQQAREELQSSFISGVYRLIGKDSNALWARYLERAAQVAAEKRDGKLAMLLLVQAASADRDVTRQQRYLHEAAMLAPDSLPGLKATYYTDDVSPIIPTQIVPSAVGSEVLVPLNDREFAVWDPSTGKASVFDGLWHAPPAPQPVFFSSPFSAEATKKLELLGLETPMTLAAPVPELVAMFSQQGRKLFAGWMRYSPQITVWDRTGHLLKIDKPRQLDVFAAIVRFNRAGSLLGVSDSGGLDLYKIDYDGSENDKGAVAGKVTAAPVKVVWKERIQAWTFSGSNGLAVAVGHELLLFTMKDDWQLKRCPGLQQPVDGLFATPDGKALASYSASTITMWDLTSCERSDTPLTEGLRVRGFSAAGGNLYAVLGEGETAELISLTGERKAVAIDFGPRDVLLPEALLALRVVDNTAEAIDLSQFEGQPREKLLATSDDGQFDAVVTRKGDGSADRIVVRKREAEIGALPASILQGANGIRWSLTGQALMGQSYNCLTIWDVGRPQEPRKRAAIGSAIDPTGQVVVTLLGEGEPSNAAANSCELRHPLTQSGEMVVTAYRLAGDKKVTLSGSVVAPLQRTAFSADGRLLALVGQNYKGAVWDTESGANLLTLGTEMTSTHVAFGGSSKLAVVHGRSLDWYQWDNGKLVRTGQSDDLADKRVVTLAWSTDASILAVGETDGTIELWRWAESHAFAKIPGVPAKEIDIQVSEGAAKVMLHARNWIQVFKRRGNTFEHESSHWVGDGARVFQSKTGDYDVLSSLGIRYPIDHPLKEDAKRKNLTVRELPQRLGLEVKENGVLGPFKRGS